MSTRSKKSTTQGSLFKTFTYFIPAPGARKSGYREREFDKIMAGILQSGFEIVELQTQSVVKDGNGGLFILALLKAKTAKSFKLDENLDLQESFRLAHTYSSEEFVLEDEEDV
jgi:hypothetical protein